MTQKLNRTALSSGWTLFETDAQTKDEIPVRTVPSVVHLDLIEAQRIPDPFIGFNELEVQWVAERKWTYRTTVKRPDVREETRMALVFEGLDTFADVKLNGRSVLHSENMFLSHRCDVTDLLKPDVDNELRIDFGSALLKGREIEKQHPEYDFKSVASIPGENGRVGVRKAQYHWGWDWGPVLMTAGPWRPIWLETYQSRISNVWFDIQVSNDNQSASGQIFVSSEGRSKSVKIEVTQDGTAVFEQEAQTGADGLNAVNITLENPKLWYPNGYGSQPLYEVRARLSDDAGLLDEVVKKTGIRRAELIQDEDEIGESFYFRVNGVDVFAGGSNWIPADNFLPRVTEQKYRDWLQLVIEGGQNMVRIWGGGIYEDDKFYDTCDELGIMVWQDFMFACASYPTYPEILASIEEEARCNLRRLRHHPSIVLYAGNNEDYQMQEMWKLDYVKEDKDPQSWLKSTFPARYIYEKLLPDVAVEGAPDVAYWPSSPFSRGEPCNDLKIGDVHQWNVWHGAQEKYQVYEQIGGRFNSEFGLEAFPALQTIKDFVSDPADLHPRSAVMDFHNKAEGHERRIGLYQAENFRPVSNLESFVYLTQVSQSEAMYFAYKPWRRQYGESRHCGGALVWQINDCWPCTSWALVDYHLRKKPAFYTIARCLAPVAVGVQREYRDWSVMHARPAKTTKWKLWVASSRLESFEAQVELRFVSIKTGKEIKPAWKKTCRVVQNGTTALLEGETQNEKEEPHVLAARVDVDGVCIARDTDWPQPLKYHSFEDRGLLITKSGKKLRISVEKPVKALVVDEIDGVKFSDNCLDVVPGDEQTIEIKQGDVDADGLVWRYLGFEEGVRGAQRESKI
ncbi:hypothetical protein G647_04560 [Cladophialophora carrionii CBS 160.54]|uniref:Beta-mannosidase B n=1 Tax=Cladophialophora carrionii CBS 160.54 TaxID=1279043 RepID=V9DGU2_9EURO|nr:uncharacterized protein G647_04560 [Cladophialophora carrionii CBS 160.54]ETI25187.1 hypothetical protein G647_04560 [Cladophialophora carrionii CBS 160.54]